MYVHQDLDIQVFFFFFLVVFFPFPFSFTPSVILMKLMEDVSFVQLSSVTLTSLNKTIDCYVHKGSKLKFVCVNTQGPLISCMVVIPTLPDEGNKGLAHTLEHLIFC